MVKARGQRPSPLAVAFVVPNVRVHLSAFDAMTLRSWHIIFLLCSPHVSGMEGRTPQPYPPTPPDALYRCGLFSFGHSSSPYGNHLARRYFLPVDCFVASVGDHLF